jgi:hypothetical protein
LLNICHIASFFPSRTVSQSGIIESKTIEPIAFQNFADTSGGSMGLLAALTALNIH